LFSFFCVCKKSKSIFVVFIAFFLPTNSLNWILNISMAFWNRIKLQELSGLRSNFNGLLMLLLVFRMYLTYNGNNSDYSYLNTCVRLRLCFVRNGCVAWDKYVANRVWKQHMLFKIYRCKLLVLVVAAE